MSLTPAQTLDPEAAGFKSEGGRMIFNPALRILFHSDLDRIGQTTLPGLFSPDSPVTVGREHPSFATAGGVPHGLDDPCVSRDQLRIGWTHDGFFQLEPLGARPLELFALDGTPRSVDRPVPPGTVIAIGDRVLLLLTVTLVREHSERFGLTGDSEAMWTLRDRIRGAAASDGSVLIHGPSGVGKELVARAIHHFGPRREHPWQALNCAAIPDDLLESELFGHVRGAFSGATADKEGIFRAAGKGTLFLDEIGELPLPLQGKLLRVLQERAIRPVGAVAELATQARVVASTNRDLDQEVAAGHFRKDLYYRLTALTLGVPALSERREDIPLIFTELLARRRSLHKDLLRLWCHATVKAPPLPLSLFVQLLAYDWPGNVRHLDNVIEKLAVGNLGQDSFQVPTEVARELARDPTRAPAAVPGSDATGSDAGGPSSGSTPFGGQVSDEGLLALLERHDYVQRRVAEDLGVSHTTIDRRMRELGLRRPRDLDREELERVSAETGQDLAAMARRLRVSRRGLKLRLTALGIEIRASGSTD